MTDPTPSAQNHQTPVADPSPPEGEAAIRPRITITDMHVIKLVRQFEQNYPSLSAPKIVGHIVTRFHADRGPNLPGSH